MGYCDPPLVLMRPSAVKILPSRPLTPGEEYVTVISWPPMVAVALAGGLLGAAFCAMRAVAAKRRPAQIMRGFMGDSPPQRPKTAGRYNGNDCRTGGCGWESPV